MGPGLGEDEFQRALLGARAGDEQAFRVLWRAFDPALVQFLSGLAGPDDGADLASTVWSEVVRNLDRFAGDEAGFRGWLFTSARRRFLDLRRNQRRRPATVTDADRAEPIDRAPGPDELVEQAWTTASAVQLIGTLPPDQAEVILLRVLADLDVDAVARIVGKRPGTVRVLTHRGLRRLAAQVARTENAAPGVTP